MKNIYILLTCACFASGIYGQADGSNSLAKFAVSRSSDDPRYWIALTSSYRCSFLPPMNWSVSQDPAKRALRFQNTNNGSVLTLRFRDDPANIYTKEEARQWVQELIVQFPGARLQQKAQINALSREALVLDLTWVSADSVNRVGRFARVPARSGYLEIAFLAATSDFDASLPAFNQFINSLQCAAPTERLALRAMPVE